MTIRTKLNKNNKNRNIKYIFKPSFYYAIKWPNFLKKREQIFFETTHQFPYLIKWPNFLKSPIYISKIY